MTPEAFHTPGRKTIADIAEFTGLPQTSQMKSLVMVADGAAVLAMVRGDHQMSEAKFQTATGATDFRPAFPEEIRQWFGAEAGSLGPVGVKNMRVLADEALRGRRNMIAGSNKDDYHLKHVTPGEDFQPEFLDLRQVAGGDSCVRCGAELKLTKMVEIGHIFKLGYKYSKSMGLHVSTEGGEEIAPIMGSYGIGLERILSAAVELHHDKDGMVLPPSIAPFTVVITPVNFGDATLRQVAERIYADCRQAGLDVVLDDRDERPGVKFKDADLVGIPFRVTVGKKAPQGIVEIVERSGRKTADVAIERVSSYLAERL